MTLSPPRPATPTPTRDRFLDVVRALAIAAVVVQHWTMPVLAYADGRLTTGNALSTPGWWVVTWLSQVMPLVFFAGGAANYFSLTRAAAAGPWLSARLSRLLLPVLPLLAVGVAAPPVLRALGAPEQPVALAGSLSAQLLWFLGVYLLTVLATPVLAAAHRRLRWAAPVLLAALAALVDVARFSDVGYVGYANAVFVWLAVHQLGFFYADGTLERLSRRGAAAMSAAGFGATAMLVGFGPYAASMIGMPGAPMSNMSPPAAVLVTLAVGQIGLVLAARGLLTSWSERPVVASTLGWLGPRFMSVYLWHMPALIVLSGVTVLWLDYATPRPGTITWLATLPGWLLAAGAILAVLLRTFARFETRAMRPVPASPTRLCVAALAGATGTLALAATGFSSAPWPWIGLVVCAYALTRVDIRTSIPT
ncbi:acyltransferase family protein [Saccharomonospora azurea]|uniref:Acyltransferase family protein n=1 Tax=Saccharomonospora azurea NA-128 TaxID=882081 RepID=H8G8D2_9PSEU|nr:acyltransferase [Saccharomonospora azurea]EHY90454.1 acyltransferase family protein [Saccharomonospora azurea NA-128]